MRVAYSNSTRGSTLVVRHWKGYLRLNSYDAFYFPGEEPKRIKESKYSFDLNYDKEIQWKLNSNNYLTDEIIQSAFLFIIEEIKKEKSKKFRNK